MSEPLDTPATQASATALPLNALSYDGATPESSFNWESPPDGVTPSQVNALRMRFAKVFDLFAKVREIDTRLVSAIDDIVPVIETIQACGFDKRENLSPFPMPGALAPLPLQMLSPGMVVAKELKDFLNTPMEAIGGATPMTVLRQISQ